MPTRTVNECIIEPLGRSSDADAALEQLLHEAYVPAGFTEPSRAAVLFRADAVHARGRTLAARDGSGALLGTVTVVHGASAASRVAAAGEWELHLLAALVRDAIAARALAVWLWTQPGMQGAQRLYSRLHFRRVPARDFLVGGREFLVYTRPLTNSDRIGAA